MYEDLLRELRCCPDAEYGCSRCKHKNSLHCRETLMQESADAIEKLKEEFADKPKWISVKERLPDDYVPVLVCAKHIDGKRTVVLADHIISYTNGCKTWADTDKTWKYSVTHWMPLPEPPKEGGNTDGN